METSRRNMLKTGAMAAGAGAIGGFAVSCTTGPNGQLQLNPAIVDAITAATVTLCKTWIPSAISVMTFVSSFDPTLLGPAATIATDVAQQIAVLLCQSAPAALKDGTQLGSAPVNVVVKGNTVALHGWQDAGGLFVKFGAWPA